MLGIELLQRHLPSSMSLPPALHPLLLPLPSFIFFFLKYRVQKFLNVLGFLSMDSFRRWITLHGSLASFFASPPSFTSAIENLILKTFLPLFMPLIHGDFFNCTKSIQICVRVLCCFEEVDSVKQQKPAESKNSYRIWRGKWEIKKNVGDRVRQLHIYQRRDILFASESMSPSLEVLSVSNHHWKPGV